MAAIRVKHLFDSPEPVLVFGGPYSNLQATQAMRAVATQLGIPADRCICTGDVVAYCANPVETVREIRDWGCAVLAGNCEKQLAEEADDCGCGFGSGTTCDRLSASWYAFASAALDAEARTWMRELPDVLTFGHGSERVLALHGGLTDISRFLWPTSPNAAFSEELSAVRRQLQQGQSGGRITQVVAGHCGMVFDRNMDGMRWSNAGAIGMPPNDGTPATRYMILEGGNVSFNRLNYDHNAAAQAMETAGLTQGYHLALRNGDWPSEDVLPAELRRQ
ncbi:metallophosphoesterase family protein [Pelagimonas varians]|uniref:Calcineurin-like phosphoesterase domain-containing protein n=1 Tax=Pelagimonas varians TaxID=696760 RepID=A0A238K846_9RHOB|nr:metallophosphoesterase family protein [Pelagimonas varians]PYG31591.1 calcineurin-like phosphoesterase family protein [Pelagimonas varians]SMX38973.1 hypothetical protein PEV8663_01636 [Pelagimonas varians]